MKKTLKDFQKQLDKSQLIKNLVKKNLKGGTGGTNDQKCPPPYGR